MKTGIQLIAEERERQVKAEGWTPEHDDQRNNSILAIEAARWAIECTGAATGATFNGDGLCGTKEHRQSKPRLRQLAIAGALIAAEIDRLQRAKAGA